MADGYGINLRAEEAVLQGIEAATEQLKVVASMQAAPADPDGTEG